MKARLISLMTIAIALLLGLAIALAGGQGGTVAGGLPVLVWCALLAYAIQWLVFLPAWLFQTERYYDLVGSLTYISVALLALAASRADETAKQLLVLMITVWAARLGTFLFLRIRADGGDSRFERIKPHFLRFLVAWTLQGLWVVVTSGAALAAVTSSRPLPLGGIVLIGAALWGAGFAIEVIADWQKRAFRGRPENQGQFIRHGLWRYSRHPNYFGEIVLWTGIAVMAFPALYGWQYLTLMSPVFVYLLLTRISGINMLEAAAERRWGDDPAYRQYREATSRLLPRPPHTRG